MVGLGVVRPVRPHCFGPGFDGLLIKDHSAVSAIRLATNFKTARSTDDTIRQCLGAVACNVNSNNSIRRRAVLCLYTSCLESFSAAVVASLFIFVYSEF